jgi:hypothetical protein
MNHLYHGISGQGYISGAGFLLSNDVEDILLENHSLLVMSRDIDDIAIGKLLHSRGINLSIGSREDIINEIDNTARFFLNLSEINAYHYRVKSAASEKNPERMQDAVIMSVLYFKCYGANN